MFKIIFSILLFIHLITFATPASASRNYTITRPEDIYKVIKLNKKLITLDNHQVYSLGSDYAHFNEFCSKYQIGDDIVAVDGDDFKDCREAIHTYNITKNTKCTFSCIK